MAADIVKGRTEWAPKCLYVKWQLFTANYIHSQVLDRLNPVDAVIAKAHVFNAS